jgi:signal peptidase I
MRTRRNYLDTQRPVKKSVGREILEWVITLGLAVGLALCVHVWVGELVTVDGPSMQPNLWKDQKVLIGKVEYYFHKPKRGDIVLVKFPESDLNYIKRVIATGGERLTINNGSAYINGKKLTEPYIAEAMLQDMDEITVPDGSVFVMGDNRNDSHDSRSEDVGAIPLNQVEGRAYELVWPFDKMKKLSTYAGTLEQ